MKQEYRDRIIFVVLLTVKLLTTLRTGLDTYTVSHDLLNVLLVDCAFLALWGVAAYGGRGMGAVALRPFAAIGAWMLYAFMLAIGWAAHHGVVAFAVRAAGALALAYDTWDYIVMYSQRISAQRKAETFETYMQRIDEAARRKSYKRAMRNTQAAKLQTASDIIAESRIVAYHRRYTQAQLASTNAESAGFALLESGHAQCLDCGWISKRKYQCEGDAQPAYAAHTRSAIHRNTISVEAR